MTRTWRDVNAIYQIYPRSFQDSNGDGIGDLTGVLRRLDYLKGSARSLGVDAIWFSPFFPSPMADFGYDVSDYCDIDPIFGTLDHFRTLLDEAHARDIKVMIDFVPNHSSSQHPWFDASRQKDPTYDAFYTWRDAAPGGGPPNNWLSIFGGSAWEWDESRQQYYLHTFLKEQPDLNWDNPAVRERMQEVVRFWCDMGVDGIRADAVRWISKDRQLRDDPINPDFVASSTADPYGSLIHRHSRFGDKLFEYLRELTDVIAEYDDRIMIFEDYPDDQVGDVKDQYLGFYGVNPSVSMPFNFEGIGLPFDASNYTEFITNFQGMLGDEHVPVYCFGNHDQSRLVSRVGREQARAVAVMQMTLPGIPVIYYGDEIGMHDGVITPDQVHDPVELRKPGLGQGRDPERTPMLWDASNQAGFSSARAWLPVGEMTLANTVAGQLDDEPDSFLYLYQQLLKIRKTYDIFRRGDYETFGEPSDSVMVYSRRLGAQHVFVAINFTSVQQKVQFPHGGRVIVASHPVDYPEIGAGNFIELRPYEAVVIECAEHPLVVDAKGA